MLYNLDDKRMSSLPKTRVKDFQQWMKALSAEDYAAVVAEINKYIDAHMTFFKSSFIPPKDWTNSVYLPLYFACNRNEQHAGFFLGLIVWKTVMDDRKDEWVFRPADKDDDILGTDYFPRKKHE
jgi:hypothetical protein